MALTGYSRIRRALSSRGRFWLIGAAVLGWCAAAEPLMAQTTIIPGGAEWRYRVDGFNQGTNWRTAAFNDLAWASGPAPLGFGEDDLATVIADGAGPTTTYFRHTFAVADWREFRTLTVRVRRDDGAVVYLNNREIVRANLPAGAVNYLTPAVASTVGAA